jgi:hypothetical protein
VTDELLRRAFSRDSTDVDRAAAQAELARDDPGPPPSPPPPALRPPAVPRLLLLALLGAVSGLGLIATVSATFVPPAVALEIFDRPPIAADAAAPDWAAPGATQARWLADAASWSVFAYRTAGDRICVAAVKLSTGAGRSCVDEARFVRDGLALTVYARDFGRVERLMLTWRPDGVLDVQIGDVA